MSSEVIVGEYEHAKRHGLDCDYVSPENCGFRGTPQCCRFGKENSVVSPLQEPTNHNASTHIEPNLDRSPCRWAGGNDYMACQVCGLEYDYRKEAMPPCGAEDRIAQLQQKLASSSNHTYIFSKSKVAVSQESSLSDDTIRSRAAATTDLKTAINELNSGDYAQARNSIEYAFKSLSRLDDNF